MLLQTMADRGATFLSAQSAAEGNRELRGSAFSVQQSRYDLLEAYYSNTIYRRSDAALAAIAAWQGLPTELRPLITAPKTAVDWWPGHVYRHGKIPFAETVDQKIIDAWMVAMVWGGWANADLLTYVRYGANLGDVFAEVEVNDERQKVYPRLHHPRYVKDLELNSTRDVIMYRLEIPDWDDQRERSYRWGKQVTRDAITTYYDDEPYGYNDMPATIENPFGFVPAVWVNHMSAGDGYHGASCLEGLLPLIDELNGLRASVNDFIHRFARQPFMVTTDDPKALLRVLNKSQERQPGDEQTAAQSALGQRNALNRSRESINVIPLPPNSTAIPLVQNLGLADADPHLAALKEEIEQALPELTLTKELRGMNYVSDPGARTLVEDGEHRLNAAAANYDRGIIRLAQMTLAIGGEIQRTGRWTDRTPQQATFAPFDLTSFQKGQLEITIDSRKLTEPTMLDKAAEATAVEALETQWGREHVGLTDEEIAQLESDRGNAQASLDTLLGRALGGAPAFSEAV
jgi:hypothetical protein